MIRKIYFNPDLHRYTDEDNIIYNSVTKTIEKYHKEFDKEYWSNYKAKQLGVSQAQVKKEWDNITKKSIDRGNGIHDNLENRVDSITKDKKESINEVIDLFEILQGKATEYDLENSPLKFEYPDIYFKLLYYIEKGFKIYAEVIVYNYKYKIAGKIDLLVIHPIRKIFAILDWKTNKDELEFKSGYYKKVNGIKTNIWVDKKEYFFHPIQHIEYCKGMKYTLQLSSYAHLVERFFFQIDGTEVLCIAIELVHIRNDVKWYNIKYLEKSVRLMMEHQLEVRIKEESIKFKIQ